MSDPQDSNKTGFKPAPNPFEKSTTDLEASKSDIQKELESQNRELEQDTPAVSSAPTKTIEPTNEVAAPQPQIPTFNGVEMVGKQAGAKELVEQPQAKKKKSLIGSWLGIERKPKTKPAEESVEADEPKVAEQTLLSWQSPEFVQTQKPFGWYLGILGFFALLIGLAIFTHQYLTVGLFALMAVALVIYANRPPRVLEYKISNYGVYVGEKKYLFDAFGSFYETNDYGNPLIELVPNKRFGTLVSLPPKQDLQDQIEQTLSLMLPKVDNREDWVDKLFRALRF